MLDKTVLIAERSGVISLDLKLFLKKFNINCEIVSTAEALAENTMLLRPDLIITDYKLNDGEKVKQTLIEISKNYHIPIIIISSALKPGVELFAKTISYCNVLTKPFDKNDLLALIKKYIFLEPSGNFARS